MKTMNERVREIRKSEKINLTMEKFGERLGVTKVAISNIENGNRKVTDQMFSAIVREFDVNPDWLRDGTGTMFHERTRNDQIEEWIGDILKNEPEGNKAMLISALASLDEEGWDTLYNLAMKMVGLAPPEAPADPVAAAEAAYEQALGFAPNTDTSALSTTEDVKENEAS